ncbi:MAG: FAD-dependent oxidoreductase [Deltaproteobacteria bacterium]
MAVAQKIRCRVETILDHGNSVYTLFLKPERLLPRFRPGQFLHLALDEYDPSSFWPESRVFSIASSPGDRDGLILSYSVRGRFTARMESELACGRQVWVKLPYGDFVIEGTRDVVLLAGGTGITAFTAFIAGLTPEYGHSVYLAYGARSVALHTYRDLLDQQARKVPSLHLFYFAETGCPETAGDPGGGLTSGCLSVSALWPRFTDPFTADYYLSGPPAMLKGLSQDLISHGIRPDAVRMDAWE